MAKKAIKLKRAYDQPEKSDGFRILVDRIWPQGVSKDDAKIDQWLKNVAPSSDLRNWFAHDPEKWEEFKKRYFKELKTKEDSLEKIESALKKHSVTLVYAAKDQSHNNAVAVKEFIEKSK